MPVASLGSALPPTLDAYVQRTVAQGAAPVPNVALETRVPQLGPFQLDMGDAPSFSLTIYPGPRLWFEAKAATGTHLQATA